VPGVHAIRNRCGKLASYRQLELQQMAGNLRWPQSLQKTSPECNICPTWHEFPRSLQETVCHVDRGG